MPVKHISTGIGLMGGGTYADKVLGTGPIAYWPLWEANGTVARCLVNPAQNGTYNSAVNTWPVGPGIGDGNTAPNFDGVNDYVNINTAAFIAAFDGQEGAVHFWAKVSAAGVWTDAAFRNHYELLADGQNYVRIVKSNVNNALNWRYRANNILESVDLVTGAPTTWMQLGISWSKTNDQVIAYYGGAQTGAIQVGLGAWAGALVTTIIGASNAIPALVWSGQIAHFAVFDYPASAAIFADLATV